MPSKTTIQCPTCNANVTKNQYSVGCGICGIYFHIKCAGVSNGELESIRKNTIQFKCHYCTNPSAHKDVVILRKIEEMQKSIEKKLDVARAEFDHRMDNGFKKFEEKLSDIVNNFRMEITNDISKLKSDISHCHIMVTDADKANDAKFESLHAKYNTMVRRLNRSDIVVSGLTCTEETIRETFIKISQFIGVHITSSDIYHCCYIAKKKAFIVKINSVQVRDDIMKKYFKAKPLCLNSIFGGSIQSRIYLNDNLSPASSKLNFLCRKLLSAKIITKFRIINMDKPKAHTTMLDGSSMTLDALQCSNLLDGLLDK